MTKGRPSLDENPYAGRMLVRNFINKYGLKKFIEFIELGRDEFGNSKSSMSRKLDVGFGTISRMYEVVFETTDYYRFIKSDIRNFMSEFYDMEL